jgi:COP9 signalosome complex subunit 5
MHSTDDITVQEELFEKTPWASDPRYFKKVVISAQALIKMVSHAKSGGSIEVKVDS